MKPTRTIEKLAYGEGTPDELADMVPTWDELDLPRSYRGWDSMGIHGSGLSIRDTRDGRWYMTAPDALSARWFAACLIAHAAGCPPHWADMGFKVNCEFFDGSESYQKCWSGNIPEEYLFVFSDEEAWRIQYSTPRSACSHHCTTELEARVHAYQLLEDGKR